MEKKDLLRFYSLKDKDGGFKKIHFRGLDEKKGGMLIHECVVKKINKKRLTIELTALPTKGKIGMFWEII